VDAPLISPVTIRALLAAFAAKSPPIVRATYRGRHGHPVVFARSVFDELRRASLETGAKAVVNAHVNDRLDLDVDDPAVVDDIDSPEDYERIVTDPR
jgi:molybdenum cofactor cytidylyltransferase